LITIFGYGYTILANANLLVAHLLDLFLLNPWF